MACISDVISLSGFSGGGLAAAPTRSVGAGRAASAMTVAPLSRRPPACAEPCGAARPPPAGARLVWMSNAQRSRTSWDAMLVTTSTIFCSWPSSSQSAPAARASEADRPARSCRWKQARPARLTSAAARCSGTARRPGRWSPSSSARSASAARTCRAGTRRAGTGRCARAPPRLTKSLRHCPSWSLGASARSVGGAGRAAAAAQARLFTAYAKNSVTILVEPLMVMVLRVACACCAIPAPWPAPPARCCGAGGDRAG